MITGFKIKHYPEMICFQIGTETEEEALSLKEKCHMSLCGRRDYIECDIVLNGYDDCKDEDGSPFEFYVNIICDNKNMDNQPVIITNIIDIFKQNTKGGKENGTKEIG